MDHVYVSVCATPTSESCSATNMSRIESLRSLNIARLKCKDIIFPGLLDGLALSFSELQVNLHVFVNVLG